MGSEGTCIGSCDGEEEGASSEGAEGDTCEGAGTGSCEGEDVRRVGMGSEGVGMGSEEVGMGSEGVRSVLGAGADVEDGLEPGG